MTDVYSATVEQAVLADKLGFDHLWFSEHHFLEDGYLPAFQPLAGAIAARTTQIRISNDIALLRLGEKSWIFCRILQKLTLFV